LNAKHRPFLQGALAGGDSRVGDKGRDGKIAGDEGKKNTDCRRI